MKVVIQRAKESSVSINNKVANSIGKGMLVFICIQKDDAEADAGYLADKLINLRIFEDEQGKMNRSIQDIKGEFLVISQFTLAGDCSKGRRPSFDKAADPEIAEGLYNYFIEQLKKSSLAVKTGEFRAMMDIGLINDGPVTFIIDSKE